MTKTFLSAEWRKLVMANYAVDPTLLTPYLPGKTEIDFHNNICYVSLVGFMFLNTRVKGWTIPLHQNFEEVNLRFYVKYNDNGDWKRGVVFIKEIVPKAALTFVAITVKYSWRKENWHSLEVIAGTEPVNIIEGSEEEFITEHYWGYTKIKDYTSEYGVEHPRWHVYETKGYSVDVDFLRIYGNDFGFLTNEKPRSVFLAEGSAISVKEGRRLL